MLFELFFVFGIKITLYFNVEYNIMMENSNLLIKKNFLNLFLEKILNSEFLKNENLIKRIYEFLYLFFQKVLEYEN